MVQLRKWDGTADTIAVQRLLSRLWPHGSHPGGLGWEAASGQLPDTTILAQTDQVTGWAGVSAGELVVQAEPEAVGALLGWALATAGDRALRIPVHDGDDALRTAVREAGFRPQPEPVVGMFRSTRSGGPDLPAGYRIHGARGVTETDRVAVHRAAWRPITMPWPAADLHRISAEATSTFTADHFRELRRVRLYDPDLDLVIEAPDGSLAAGGTLWWDPATGCAEIEPLGVVPEHRRKGLASALCLEAARLIADRGGDRLFINTGPRADYPAPAATYLTVGFQVVPRGQHYRRPAS